MYNLEDIVVLSWVSFFSSPGMNTVLQMWTQSGETESDLMLEVEFWALSVCGEIS